MPSIADILGRRRGLPPAAPKPLVTTEDYADSFDATLARLDADPDSVMQGIQGPDYTGQLERERAASKARPMGSKLRDAGVEAWKYATGRSEVQQNAGEYLASNARALREMHSNRGNVGAAQAFGFMEGATEAVPRVLNPTTMAGLASGMAPAAMIAQAPRAALLANEGLQLSDALASAKESADAFGEGNTGQGLSGLAMSTVAAIGSALGLRGLMTPRAKAPGAGDFQVRHYEPRQPPPPPQLPEHILDADLIHEAGPSSLDGPRGLLPPPGGRPGDGGAIITPPPPPGPGAPPRLSDALNRQRSQMPPARPDPFADLQQPGPITMNVAQGIQGPLAPGLMDAMAPPPPPQQKVHLMQPVTVFGERINDVTILGDQVLLHRPDGTTMPVPRATAEQMGVKLPPPPSGLRGNLEALQAQRAPQPAAAAAPGVAEPAMDAGVPPMEAAPPPREPGPMSGAEDSALMELMDALQNGRPMPPGGDQRVQDILGMLQTEPTMEGLAGTNRVPRAEAPPFDLQSPRSTAPDATQQGLPADMLGELERMFAEPELPTPAAREWKPPAAADDVTDLGDIAADASPDANNVGLEGADIINPRGAGYTQNVLRQAAPGQPGFAAEGNTLVYRGPDGTPVGVATIAADGKTIVDFAVDKTRGMLGGRAAKAIGDELQARGINAVEGGMTPDAQKFMERVQRGRKPKAEPVDDIAALQEHLEGPPAQTEIARPQEQALSQAAGAEGLDEDAITHATRELGLAGESMSREDLVRHAFTDATTGLPNRRGLEHLQGAPSQRTGGNDLFAAVDIKNLKAVNDLMGMGKGDELIKAVAKHLGGAVRKGEFPARYGGDEFMLALKEVGEAGRPVLQQKLAQAVDAALEEFGHRQVGDFPLGARFAFGADEASALDEMTRQKGLEKGPKFRPMQGATGELPQAPPNPTPGIRYEMPAAAIEVDAQRFQYRKNVDKRGVDPERAIEGKYDPARGGVIGVWRDPESGKTIVVNGHHRLKLAQEQGADVAVVYLNAKDAAGARAEGAMINMAEGNSSMADAVNFMRDAGVGVEELRKFGISPRSTIGKDGPAIAGLADPVRQKWEAGDLDDGQAAIIGHAKLQPEQQAAVAQLVERQRANGRGITPNILRNVIEQVKRADTVNMAGQGAQSNIFDVLGEDQFASSAITRAELTDHIRTQLAKDKRLFGYVSKGDRAGKLESSGVGSIDAAKAGDIAADAKKVEGVFDQLERTRGPINDALNEAARRIMQGENANVVRQEALAAIRLGVETELRNPGAAAASAPESGSAAPVPRGDGQAVPLREVGPDSEAPAGRAVDEPQPRLPGEVGDVRDVEQPPALFDAPYALTGKPAGDKTPTQTDALSDLEDVIDHARPATAAELAQDLADLRASKPRPIEKLFGKNGPTPEQKAQWDAEMRAWNATHRKLTAEHKAALVRDNAAFADRAEGKSIVEQVDEIDLPEDATAGVPDALDDLGEEIGAVATYDALAANKRDFLIKRLKYTKDDINAMTVQQANEIGTNQVYNPKLTERNADATARYDATLDDLSRTFEQEQPKKLANVIQRTRDLRAGQRRPAEAPQGAALDRARERQAPMREGAERELADARATPADEKRAATPSEMKKKQDAMAHRARAIHKAMESGDYDEAARIIGEQAEDWNNARMKAGTKEEGKVPGKHRNGEYLASDFAAVHQVLFTPEGRAKLAAFTKDAAKNPAIRGLVGGVVGAYTGDNAEERFERGLLGMVAAAGAPKGKQLLADAFDHYKRTGSIMRKSPRVPNKDIGYWRAFVAPNTIERTVPELFASTRDVLKDLQEYRASNPGLKPEQHGAAEKIARGEIVGMIRKDAAKARANKQPNLATRLEMTANQMAGRPTAGQKLVKDTLEHTGIKKKATGREFEHVAQKAIYRVALGYAVDSAAKNLFQPTLALLHVSPRNMVRAMRAARTSQADELFNSLDLELRRPVETGDDDMGELLGVTHGGRASDSGRFMRATDNWNRKWVFMGSLAEQGELDAALAGKASPKAIEEATRVMRMTQGETGPMSSSPTFRGPVGGTMKPFMKYPNLAIENILDAFQGEAKYPKTAVATMLGLGLVGAGFGLDLTDILIGGARPLGLDPFHPHRAQLPPAIAAGKRALEYLPGGKAQVFGDFFPASGNTDDVLNSDLATLVAGRYPVKVAKTLTGLSASDDPLGDLGSLVGLTTSEKSNNRSREQLAYERMTDYRNQSGAESKRLRGRLEKAIKGGDTDGIAELEQLLTPSQVKEVERKIGRGKIENTRRGVPLKFREKFDAEFADDLARERAQR